MNTKILVVALFCACTSSAARGQVWIASSFPTRELVQDRMIVHRAANVGYVLSHFGDGAVDVVDLASNRVMQTVPVPHGSAALSPDERFLAIANPSQNQVVVLDTTAGLSATRVALPGPGSFVEQVAFADDRTIVALASDSTTSRTRMWTIPTSTLTASPALELPAEVLLDTFAALFVPLPTRRAALIGVGRSVLLLDYDSPESIVSIPLGAAAYHAVVAPDGHTVWMVTSADTVVSVDVSSAAVLHSWPTARSPRRLALDSRRGTLVLMCDQMVQVLDAATGTSLATVPTPGIAWTNETTPLPIIPEVGLALVPALNADAVHVVDVAPESATFGTRLQTISLANCSGFCRPHDVVLSPDGRWGYVLSMNRFHVDVLRLPLPSATITLVPRAYRVLAGTSLPFDVVVRNATDSPLAIDAWFDVLRPNGQPIRLNPVVGPASHVFAPRLEIRRSLALRIGGGVRPSGPYTLRATVGSFPSSSLDVSEIRFAIGP